MRQTDDTPQDSLPEIGAIIDSRYQLLEAIGSGATGAVYKARHVGIGRMVAVKLAKPDIGNLPEIAARFEREALAIGLISHPNCVAVLDSDQLANGTRFLAMELLQGQSLADLLAGEERLSVTRALHIVRHVLRGLSHAHVANVVHRDIKPENIFLVAMEQDRDFAKILDFGLAKLVTETSNSVMDKSLTKAGMTFGTPRYMSPEQICGKPVDARSDLYAVAVLLYEMIAGRPPFEGDDPMAVLPMHLSCEPPPISELEPTVEILPELEQIILQGLEKRPERRFASSAEFLAAIEEVCSTDWVEEHTPMPSFFPTESQLAIETSDYQKMREREPAPPVYIAETQQLVAAPAEESAAPAEESAAPAAKGAASRAKSSSERAGSSRLHLYYGSALLALVIAAGLWFTFSRPKKVDIVGEAQELLEQGKAKAVIALLNAKPERLEGDSEGLLVLAHAYDADKNYAEAAEAYEQAIVLRPELATDARLRENVRSALSEGSVATRKIALGVLESIVRITGDESAKQELVSAGSAHPKLPTRQAARSLAEGLGLGDRLDRLQSFTLDLTEPDACPMRKRAVAKLRKLGDKRAIPILVDARERWHNKKNTNLCLRAAADAAIAHLKSLP